MKTAKLYKIAILFLLSAIFFQMSYSEKYLGANGPFVQCMFLADVDIGAENIVHWSTTNVTWKVNSNGAGDGLSFNTTKDAVQNAFNSWQNVSTSDIAFTYSGSTSSTWSNDGENVHFWAERGNSIYSYIEEGTLAITLITFNANEELSDVDIVFNGRDYAWKVDGNNYDIEAVSAHEIGHMIGLHHTEISTSPLPTMYPVYQGTAWRSLEFDDETGSSFLYGGKLIDNETLSGTNYFHWSITGVSCKTLTVNSGAILRFDAGKSLTANGTLSVNGSSSSPVTFTSVSGTSPGSWGSISLNGSGASGSNLNYINMYYGTEIQVIGVPSATIQNSKIENTINGVRFNGSNGWIVSNTIKNVQDHGIIGEGASTPSCYHNKIFKNSDWGYYQSGAGILFTGGSHDYIWHNDIKGFNWGVGTIYSSSPQFGHPSNADINNRITNCLIGLEIYSYSNPIVGIIYYSSNYFYGNSIHNNVSLDAEVTSHCSVYAHNVYWGSSGPSYYTDYSSTFYSYPYWLSTDPWAGVPLPSRVISVPPVLAENGPTKKDSPTSASLISTGGDQKINHLFEGITYREQGKHKEAFNVFAKMIADNEEPEAALVELYNTYSDSVKEDVFNYFNTVSKEKYPFTSHLLAILHVKRGEIAEAKAVNESIIKKYPNTDDETHAKIQQLYIALYHEKNFTLASSQLADIQKAKNVVENIEVSLAQHALDTYANANDGAILKKESKTAKQIASEFELKQNYPNPFNPSTTISYDLPKAEDVTLKVFDALGREVTTLVNEIKSAGTYNVQFNGSSLSSGVYFYRLQAGSYVDTKKLVLMK